MIKSLQAKTHIALGQAFLVVTVLLAAMMVGLVPDRHGAIREGRAALAEAIAIKSSTLMIDRELDRLETTLRFILERNDDLVSAAVRRGSGSAVVTIGDHDGQWLTTEEGVSTGTQVVVPIWSGDELWGQVELRFVPLGAAGLVGLLQQPWVPLVLFTGFFAFVVFYFYLGRVLRHLDPNRAVPTHVRSALDTLAEGLLVVDLKGNVVLANSSFAKITGEEATALVGRKVNELSWVNENGAACDPASFPWVTALRYGIAQRNDLLHYNNTEGTLHSFQVNSSPVLGSGGKHSGVLISFDDVTALETHKAQLRESRDEAESANRAKSEFLAAMSHEIRTPMNAILGFTHVLKRGYAKSEKEWRRYLDTIHASGTHLLQVINDVLDLSKVESGRLDVEQIPCSPYGLVAEAASILSVKAQEKGLDLLVRCGGDIPQTIVSDPTRVRQIVTNLIGNAVKFTDSGSVTVTVRLIDDGDSEPLFCIDVADTGVGVSHDRLDAIFDPFTQADSSVTRQFGGTGLGLSISRKFARALGGDIVVTSELGVGSTFSVRVTAGSLEGVPMLSPEDVARHHDERPQDTAGPAVQFAGSRVLVVDDGEENRELARLLLEDVGLIIEEAENGRIGADKAMAADYDAILMDMQMPVMSGLEATEFLRRQGVTTPVIALTANAMQRSHDECMAAGCNGFLTKPIDADRLLETLAEFLPLAEIVTGDKTSSAADAAAGGDDVEAARDAAIAQSPRPADTTGAVYSRLACESKRYDQIIQRFIDRLGAKLEEFDAALDAGDFVVLESLAQWLRGSAVTVGFDAFKLPSKTLETLSRRRDVGGISLILGELRELAARLHVAPDRGSAPQVTSAVMPIVDSAAEEPSPEMQPEPPRTLDAPPTGVASGLAADPRFQRIRERFIKRLETRLDGMERCLKDCDFEELAKHGHWLKGSGGTVGFDAFNEPAKALENAALGRDMHAAWVAMAELRRIAATLQVGPAAPDPRGDADPPALKEAGGVPIS